MVDMIEDGRSITGFSLDTWRKSSKIARMAHRRGFRIPMLSIQSDPPGGVPLPAIVNHGRWIVECPGPCSGALEVWREGPHLFWCLVCAGRSWGGGWLPVALPEDTDAVEAALLAEPNPAKRNWRPSGYVEGG